MKSEWSKVPLSHVAEVQTGPFGSQLHNKDYVAKGTPIVTVEHLGSRSFTTQNLPCVSEEDRCRLSKYYLRTGDIVFSRVGSVDRCSYVNEANSGWLFSGRCLRVRSSNIHPEFLYYFFCQESVKEYIKSIAVGATMPSINTKLLNDVEVILPPLPIQRKIASILSALDDKIETNNAICRNLEELLLAVYRNVKYVNECVVKELRDLAEFSKNKKQISELNCQSYFSTENMLPGKAGAVAAESLPTMPKATACNPGDILVSNIRPYFKKIVYCSTNCGCSSDVLCFHPKEDIYSTWLFCSLYEDDFFDYVAAGSKGTKMPRGDKAHIMRYGIDVPPRKKLEEFKSMGNLVLTQINNLRSENKYLSQLRDSILPKLMNGELDVDKIEL